MMAGFVIGLSVVDSGEFPRFFFCQWLDGLQGVTGWIFGISRMDF